MLSMLLALFYEKRKSRNLFLHKEKFQAQLPQNEKTLKSVREQLGKFCFLPLLIFTNLDFWNYWNEDNELRELSIVKNDAFLLMVYISNE